MILIAKKLNVGVLFGGVSSEHEVSRLSVTSVLEHLDRSKYNVIPLGINRAGRWFHYKGDISLIADGRWETSGQITPVLLAPSPHLKGVLIDALDHVRAQPLDVVFPVLHGKNGEDGTVQGVLELAGIPYVGCGVTASANCMDKDVAKRLFAAAGIPVARWETFYPEDLADFDRIAAAARMLGFPVFVKPAAAGSSVGVSRASNEEELRSALEEAFRQDRKVLVEEAVSGAEVECAVMGNHANCVTSDVLGEIVPKRTLYDYEGKYLDGSTELFIPARIPAEQTALIKKTALAAYRALDCAGLSRVDFFAKMDGSVILNEINTLPGFTNISMFPKLFMASGLTYEEILDRLISLALEEHPARS